MGVLVKTDCHGWKTIMKNDGVYCSIDTVGAFQAEGF